jgi:hypothetical protein
MQAHELSSPVGRRMGAASVGAWHTCGQVCDKLNGRNNFNRNELRLRNLFDIKYNNIKILVQIAIATSLPFCRPIVTEI